MAIDQETEMTDAEIDDFLSRHETGVLSLARTDDPYAIPISYGYDEEEREFYMRMVSTPESEKRQFLESTAYRKVEMLTEADLVDEQVRINTAGKHATEYSESFDDVYVSVDGGVIEIRMTKPDAETDSAASYAVADD